MNSICIEQIFAFVLSSEDGLRVRSRVLDSVPESALVGPAPTLAA